MQYDVTMEDDGSLMEKVREYMVKAAVKKVKEIESKDAEMNDIDKCIWMYETKSGWRLYSKETMRTLEKARRSGSAKVTCTVEGERVTIYVIGSDDNLSHEKGDTVSSVRRHILGDGLEQQ